MQVIRPLGLELVRRRLEARHGARMFRWGDYTYDKAATTRWKISYMRWRGCGPADNVVVVNL